MHTYVSISVVSKSTHLNICFLLHYCIIRVYSHKGQIYSWYTATLWQRNEMLFFPFSDLIVTYYSIVRTYIIIIGKWDTVKLLLIEVTTQLTMQYDAVTLMTMTTTKRKKEKQNVVTWHDGHNIFSLLCVSSSNTRSSTPTKSQSESISRRTIAPLTIPHIIIFCELSRDGNRFPPKWHSILYSCYYYY